MTPLTVTTRGPSSVPMMAPPAKRLLATRALEGQGDLESREMTGYLGFVYRFKGF